MIDQVVVRRDDVKGPFSGEQLLQVTTWSFGFGAPQAQEVLLSHPF